MQPDSAPDVSAGEAVALLAAEPTAVLLDVREQHEWDLGHAPQATLLPMSQLSERVGELPQDVTLVCVCHVGGRSAMVAAALNRAGWRAVNLVGGMLAWEAAGYEVVDADGRPGVAE